MSPVGRRREWGCEIGARVRTALRAGAWPPTGRRPASSTCRSSTYCAQSFSFDLGALRIRVGCGVSRGESRAARPGTGAGQKVRRRRLG
eukprot:5357734-Pyramimonas_sp.AAC.1